MSSFDTLLASWQAFFAAQLGAGAPLLGLVFVGLSMNLARIIADQVLPRRALIALILLMQQVIVSSIALIPDQGPRAVGIEILAVAATVWVATLWISLPVLRPAATIHRAHSLPTFLLLQAALLPYLAGGAMLLAGMPQALHLVALGMMLSFVKAGIEAWVLLVEINR